MATYTPANGEPVLRVLSSTTVDTVSFPKADELFSDSNQGRSIVVKNVLGSTSLKVTTGPTGYAVSPSTATIFTTVPEGATRQITVGSAAVDVKVLGSGNTYSIARGDSRTAALRGSRGQALSNYGDLAAGTYTLDTFVPYGVVAFTLTGNVTLNKGTIKDGDRLDIIFTQDGTGSRTVTWGSGINVRSWSITGTASASTSISLISDGAGGLIRFIP